MAVSTQRGDIEYTEGIVRFRDRVSLPANSVGDNQVSELAPLGATKTVHQFITVFSQPHGTGATDQRAVIHVARSAGDIVEVRAGPVVAAVGDSTVTADVLVGGVSILDAPILIDSGDAAYDVLTGVLETEEYALNDVFEVAIDATVGTGTLPQGVFVSVTLRESP